VGIAGIVAMLVVAIVAVLLVFGAVQWALKNWFGIEVELVPDVWSAFKAIPEAIGKAISDVLKALGDFFAAPFKAFARTLMLWGLPPGFAWGVAIFIIVLTLGAVLLGVAKARGWL